jgi:hypothetical protein
VANALVASATGVLAGCALVDPFSELAPDETLPITSTDAGGMPTPLASRDRCAG